MFPVDPGSEVICPMVVVSGADYADCNGRYEIVSDVVEWAPRKPVYKHVSRDRSVTPFGGSQCDSTLKYKKIFKILQVHLLE